MKSNLPKAVALGGGHGLSASLQALRQVTDQLTAIVTVADDGGSSGRLRKEFGGLPPGDLRMAMAALAGDNARGRNWSRLLQERFIGEGPLAGHAVGNLLIEAAWQGRDSVVGLDMLGWLLELEGRVLPMSTEPLQIEADVLGLLPDDPAASTVLRGQHEVGVTRGTVTAVRLLPGEPPACREAVAAVRDADYVFLGPGSWFTSVIPHLLVPGLAEAITNTAAKRILNLNVVSAQETEGFSPGKHIELLTEHAPGLRLDYVLADQSFGAGDAQLAELAAGLGAQLVVADVRMHDGTARHDPLRLASLFRELMIG